MNQKELLSNLEERKNNMYTQVNNQLGLLKEGYTREQAKNIYDQINIVKQAELTKYRNNESVANYLIRYFNDGYNRYRLEGKFKTLVLYRSDNDFMAIKDKLSKDFIMVYFDVLKENS
jgi:hypothetical protein